MKKWLALISIILGEGKRSLVTEKKTLTEDKNSLKGTFASVLLLGAFLFITWLCVFFLFIYRG